MGIICSASFLPCLAVSSIFLCIVALCVYFLVEFLLLALSLCAHRRQHMVFITFIIPYLLCVLDVSYVFVFFWLNDKIYTFSEISTDALQDFLCRHFAQSAARSEHEVWDPKNVTLKNRNRQLNSCEWLSYKWAKPGAFAHTHTHKCSMLNALACRWRSSGIHGHL